MNPSIQDSTYLWQVLTHIGSASLILPVFAIAATALWWTGQKKAAMVWLMALVLAVALTLATKILFFGWGIGIAAINFTGISGHTLLATSILPVLLAWLTGENKSRPTLTGAFAGLLLAVIVGLSRLVLGAHTISEIVPAWIIGFVVSNLTLRSLDTQNACPSPVRLSPLLFLLSFTAAGSSYLPTEDWEIKLALMMSGRERPFNRQLLASPPIPKKTVAKRKKSRAIRPPLAEQQLSN